MKILFASLAFLIMSIQSALADPATISLVVANAILTAGGPLVIGGAAVSGALAVGSLVASAVSLGVGFALPYSSKRFMEKDHDRD